MNPKTFYIKRRAMETAVKSRPSLLLAALIVTAASFVIGLIVSKLSPSIALSDLNQLANAVAAADETTFTAVVNSIVGKLIADPRDLTNRVVIILVLQCGYLALSTGYTLFLMRSVRDQERSYSSLLDGFGVIFRVILLNVILYLITAFFSLLSLAPSLLFGDSGFFAAGVLSVICVIPSAMLFYSYRQSIYILLDNPGKSVFSCMTESRRMMRGHKKELFFFDLNFILWELLSMMGLFGYLVDIWVLPYVGTARFLFYEILRGAEAVPANPLPPAE